MNPHREIRGANGNNLGVLPIRSLKLTDHQLPFGNQNVSWRHGPGRRDRKLLAAPPRFMASFAEDE
jgi:hypothetical protein